MCTPYIVHIGTISCVHVCVTYYNVINLPQCMLIMLYDVIMNSAWSMQLYVTNQFQQTLSIHNVHCTRFISTCITSTTEDTNINILTAFCNFALSE